MKKKRQQDDTLKVTHGFDRTFLSNILILTMVPFSAAVLVRLHAFIMATLFLFFVQFDHVVDT